MSPIAPVARPSRARGLVAAAVAVLLATLGWIPVPAAAEDQESARDALLEATEEEIRLLAELTAIEAERDRLNGELSTLDEQLRGAEDLLGAAEDRLAVATANLATLERRLERTSQSLDEAVGLLQEQAVDAFVTGGSAAIVVNEYLEADNLRELGAAQEVVDTVIEQQNEVVEDVTDLEAEVARLTDEAAEAREEAARARNQAEERRDLALVARDASAARRADAQAAADAHLLLLDQVRAEKVVYEAQLAAQAAVSSSLSLLLREYQDGQPVVPPTRGMLAPPLPDTEVTSGFGYRVHPIFGDVRLHMGLDLSASSGTPIQASAAGTVVVAGPQGGYGNAVVVDHGGALATLYAHQSVIEVQLGDQVLTGDVIGLVGSTGNSTGPHLHYEVRVLGAPVDPLAYL